MVLQPFYNRDMAGEIEHIKGKGFDANPQNINRKGQPVSIKNQLKEILLKDGELPIPAEQFIKMTEKNGKEYYVFKIPTQNALALKLVSMAMGRNNNAFQAIKLVQEMFDGKSKQNVDITTKGQSLLDPYDGLSLEELEIKLNESRKSIKERDSAKE